MAGSKRRHLHSHTITATDEQWRALHSMPEHVLRALFQTADEHGHADFPTEHGPYMLQRHPDHTFTVTDRAPHHHMVY